MAQSLVRGVHTGWQTAAPTQARPLQPLSVRSPGSNMASSVPLGDRASAARIRSPNGLFTVNRNYEQPGSSFRNSSNTPPFGQWGTFGPDGSPITAATQPYVTAAETIARRSAASAPRPSTSGSQGGGATGFTGGGMMGGGNSQLPGLGGGSFAGLGGGGFTAPPPTMAGGGGGMSALVDLVTSMVGGGGGGTSAIDDLREVVKPKPEPGTGPGWKDPRDPLTMTGGGYPADDVTHGQALAQQLLASNPRMPVRGDPSGRPGPKPPSASKPKPGRGGRRWR